MPWHKCKLRLFACLILILSYSQAMAEWQRIDVNGELLEQLFADKAIIDNEERLVGFIDDQGKERFPGCSEAPQLLSGENGPFLAPHDGSFAFFVDYAHGNFPEVLAKDLLIYFNGGGGCWNAATCIGSALTPKPVFSPAVIETESYLDFISLDPDNSGVGGILTSTRAENPYRDFAKIYIPYCTGDIHIGSNDEIYNFVAPEFGLNVASKIRHRGFDNLLVVLKWLKMQQSKYGINFDKLAVAGSSAGGYGALANFPVIRKAIGDSPKYFLIVDSSNGVVTDGFVDTAFGTGTNFDGVWHARANLDSRLLPFLDQDAKDLWGNIIKKIGKVYPKTRIAQSTTAYDIVQTLFLLNMRKVDEGSYNPFEEPNETELFLTALFEWSPKARLAMIKSSLSLPNYRFYLAAGEGHVHLLDPPKEIFPFPTPNYFAEASARGIKLTDWLDDMLNNPRNYLRTNWRNLSCFPNCLP